MTLLLRALCYFVDSFCLGPRPRRPKIDTNAWHKTIKPPHYRVPDFVDDVDRSYLNDPELEFTNHHYPHIIRHFNACFKLPAASKTDSCPSE